MFVRIIRGHNDALYECSHVRVNHDTEKRQIGLVMEDLPGRVSPLEILVDKEVPEALGIYLMNHSGRTVDTLFRKEATGKVAVTA